MVEDLFHADQIEFFAKGFQGRKPKSCSYFLPRYKRKVRITLILLKRAYKMKEVSKREEGRSGSSEARGNKWPVKSNKEGEACLDQPWILTLGTLRPSH